MSLYRSNVLVPTLALVLGVGIAIALFADELPPPASEPAAPAPADSPTPEAAEPATPAPAREDTAPPQPATPTRSPTPSGPASGGVTAEPCPAGVNPGNGCVYLGALEDRTDGPLAASGRAQAEARRAFWARVNAAGGIGGYDIDVTTYERDTAGDPEQHARAYAEVRDEVVALAQSQGLAATAAILDDLRAARMVAVPASAVSAWAAEDAVALAGAAACVHAANGVDHVAERAGPVASVAVLHYPGAYGEDAAAGAEHAARRHGASVTRVEAGPADHAVLPERVAEALTADPDVLVVATGPAELGAIVDRAVAAGFDGTIVAPAAAWDARLVAGRAAALARHLRVLGSWPPLGAHTDGHEALRAALGGAEASEAHVAGWAAQYPLRAALEAASAADGLTPPGVTAAHAALDAVDGEGMLPPDAAGAASRHSTVSVVDPGAPTSLRLHRPFFAGPTARDLDLPCR